MTRSRLSIELVPIFRDVKGVRSDPDPIRMPYYLPSSRPLKVRVGLRDLWESPNAPAQKAIKALKEVLGYQVDVSIDIALLWSELQRFFPDPETFIPSITSVVLAWAECLLARLEDEGNAAWTEKLLVVVMEQGTVVKVRVEVSLSTQFCVLKTSAENKIPK